MIVSISMLYVLRDLQSIVVTAVLVETFACPQPSTVTCTTYFVKTLVPSLKHLLYLRIVRSGLGGFTVKEITRKRYVKELHRVYAQTRKTAFF